MDEDSPIPPGLVRSLSISNLKEDPSNASSIKTADRTVALTSLMGAEAQLTPDAEDLLRLIGLTHSQEEDEQHVREQIDQVRLREQPGCTHTSES